MGTAGSLSLMTRTMNWLSRYRWYATVLDNNIYAAASSRGGTRAANRPIRMHVLLTGYALTDHIDGNGLNNQRYNLRTATVSQNLMNRGRPANNTSGFKGVSRQRDKWVAGIKADGVHQRRGGFSTPEQAARAYDAMAVELHGEFARLNFPDDAKHEIPSPAGRPCARPGCGNEIAGRRSNARYCSSRCSDFAHYQRKLAAQAASSAA